MRHQNVTCSISPMSRWGLTRLKEKDKQRQDRNEMEMDRAVGQVGEFKDARVTTAHPHVDTWLLDSLFKLDDRLFLCWELQHYFEHRWHVKMLDDDGDVKSILMLQHPWTIRIHEQGDYLPFNSEALSNVRRLMHQIRHGLQQEVIDAHQEKNDKERLTKEADRKDIAEQKDKEERRVQERLTGRRNISDPGWERGIGIDKDGVPYIDGKGAHTEERTSAF